MVPDVQGISSKPKFHSATRKGPAAKCDFVRTLEVVGRGARIQHKNPPPACVRKYRSWRTLP